MSLSKRIEKTKDFLEDYDMMPHDEGSDEIIMKNQQQIMLSLQEILSKLEDLDDSWPYELGPP